MAGALYKPSIGTDSVTLAGAYVERLLNARDQTIIQEYFHPSYLDHDPLPGQSEGRNGLYALAETLNSEEVRFQFWLEAITGDERYAGYHLFGTGEIRRQSYGVANLPTLATVECTGLFRIERGLLAERWGPMTVSVSR
jgi:hypothetical protein